MGLLYDYQVVLNAGFTKVTSRSINNFGFLDGEVYGSSVKQLLLFSTYNIWYTKKKGRVVLALPFSLVHHILYVGNHTK